MSDDAAPVPPTPPPSLSRVLATILADVRLVLFAVVALFGGGWAAFAQVKDVAKDAAATTTAGLDASVVVLSRRLDGHEAASLHTHNALREEIIELKIDTRATRAEVEGLRADLRRLLPALPPTSRDGGSDGGSP